MRGGAPPRLISRLPAQRYNVAPTQDILDVRFNPETKQRTLDALWWRLVPFWANDIKIGYSLINAKAETVAEKPAFREASSHAAA
jgi:putative SOS response-associated peptidase YedK